ncbi:Molybdopterin binding protein [Amniculicola lignicola CBS 123094]|uniref:Molybdopterin binding protein n=1 Tax=Amniculicola lignicola CBS 123094 TaxID=1392246 RepID=A0A6A5VT55_9PLEO|nr:Molybdopterin binding protein [Amniculicola lignicola CBS 123094]
MFSRISQVARHLARPLPNYAHISAGAANRRQSPVSSSMSLMATTHGKQLIHTAACLIIGDEVLGGKTVDTNSAYLAKFCFSLGINLRRIEVIADDEDEIIEAARRMSKNYDFVVTSGGIGPTHDDITYQSIAKAFGLPLKLHDAAYERMKRLSKPHKSQPDFDWNVPSAALTAKKRMVELPLDDSRPYEDQVIFTQEELWVPVSCVNGNIHILPGVPSLFQRMLDGLKVHLVPRLSDPEGKGVHRILFSTPLPESAVAEYLTHLAAKVKEQGISVGSYPRWGKSRNTVTLVGRDADYMETLVLEVEEAVQGRRVSAEDEMDSETEPDADKPS